MKKQKKGFLEEFFKNHNRIGSVSPSSKYLTKKMLENIDFEDSKIIVEYGAGTGVFTREIIKRMLPDAKLYVFELHLPFFKKLQKEFQNNKNVVVLNDSAVNIIEHIKTQEGEFADAIISSLPFTNFDNKLTLSILNNSKEVLKTEGKFIQYQYTLNAKKILKQIFSLDSIGFAPINLPPAFVYTCSNRK